MTIHNDGTELKPVNDRAESCCDSHACIEDEALDVQCSNCFLSCSYAESRATRRWPDNRGDNRRLTGGIRTMIEKLCVTTEVIGARGTF